MKIKELFAQDTDGYFERTIGNDDDFERVAEWAAKAYAVLKHVQSGEWIAEHAGPDPVDEVLRTAEEE